MLIHSFIRLRALLELKYRSLKLEGLKFWCIYDLSTLAVTKCLVISNFPYKNFNFGAKFPVNDYQRVNTGYQITSIRMHNVFLGSPALIANEGCFFNHF